ncbi:MAG: hypothetical protein ISQ14_13875 [Verrucomicrobiae bacterium]|nr:hypothetical protein [Verrucomicrobiae bacterium]
MSKIRKPLATLSGTSGEIAEDRYRHDLALHDRFQQFGSELLRIASMGLAAFGFVLLTESSKGTFATEAMQASCFLRLIVSLFPVFFGICIAFSLMHRFLASDGMFHHFRAIKLIDLNNPKDKDHADRIVSEERRRNEKFKQSERCLHLSALSLGLGAALLTASFVWIVALL